LIGQAASATVDAIGLIAIAQGIARVAAIEIAIASRDVAKVAAALAALAATQKITHLIVCWTSGLILAATEIRLRARRACAVRIDRP
jgi:hypothetical protein